MEPVSLGDLHYVYILQNPNGTFYVGQTEDLTSRMESHNDTLGAAGKYTRKNGPWKLIWSEQHPSRASAMARERQIKSMKSSRWIREVLLNGRVPTRRD
jgi:predicted GIY-YIG superfamily endonuclease